MTPDLIFATYTAKVGLDKGILERLILLDEDKSQVEEVKKDRV